MSTGHEVMKRCGDDLDEFRFFFSVEDKGVEFWEGLVEEEGRELREASMELLKELIDCLYVQAGMYLAAMDANHETKQLEALLLMRTTFMEATRVFSEEEVWKAWDAVHKNNMSKVGEDGTVKRDPDTGKVLKPDNYVPVDLGAIFYG